MINPNEYNTLIINLQLSVCKFVDMYCNKSDYNIQSRKDKLTLILITKHLQYMTNVTINPINENDEILRCDGQVLEDASKVLDASYTGTILALKQYDENKIISSLRKLNRILKAGYTLKIYPDKYYIYAPYPV
jgi:hypothetical protein